MFLLRHGATANNVLRPPRIQGCGSDLELSEEGRAQARRASETLANQTIDAVFSSPLKRAVQTAEAIALPRGLSVRAIDALKECDVGAWEGKSWEEIARENPEEHRRFLDDPATFGYRGGENLRQVENRVRPALDELLANHLGKTIVVVAHNVVNRVYLGGLIDVPLSRRRGVPQENCCINIVRYQHGAAKLVTLNRL